jgi:hypothetical protein
MAKASPQREQYIPPVPVKTEGTSSTSKNIVKNTWLLFGESSALFQNLTNHIEQLGKKVIQVEDDSEGFKEIGNNHFKISGDSLEDFQAIYNSLR